MPASSARTREVQLFTVDLEIGGLAVQVLHGETKPYVHEYLLSYEAPEWQGSLRKCRFTWAYCEPPIPADLWASSPIGRFGARGEGRPRGVSTYVTRRVGACGRRPQRPADRRGVRGRRPQRPGDGRGPRSVGLGGSGGREVHGGAEPTGRTVPGRTWERTGCGYVRFRRNSTAPRPGRSPLLDICAA